MSVKKRNITIASIVYLYTGVFIFILGWLSWFVAILCSILTLFSLAIYFKDVFKNEEVYYIRKGSLCLIIGFFILACIICGHGAFIAQTGDWEKHNAVLRDLIFKSWPVVYNTETESAMLSYYIGHYLPIALVGHIFGSFRIAEITLVIWNVIGLFLAYINVAAKMNVKTYRKHIFILLSFALFGGMYALIDFLLKRKGIDIFSITYMLIPSNAAQLRWAFIQAIPTWIVTALLFREPNKIENYCVIGVPLIISSTIPFAGLVIVMVLLAISNFDFKNISRAFFPYVKKIFSLQNILIVLGCASVLIIYIYSNVGQKKPEGAGFSAMEWSSIKFWISYVVLELTSVLFIFAPLYLVNKKAPNVVWVSFITLLIIPLFRMGMCNDWCMRVGIPAFFILMLYAIDTVSSVFENSSVPGWKKRLSITVCGLILMGTTYTLGGMVKKITQYGVNFDGKARCGRVVSLEEWCVRDGSISTAEAYNYFIYDYGESLFYKTISRRVE